MTDIQPGDVVVCVTVRLPEYRDPATRLVRGRTYRVDDVYASRAHPGRIGVIIRGVKPLLFPGFDARLFRKIRPAGRDFIAEIKRVKEPA